MRISELVRQRPVIADCAGAQIPIVESLTAGLDRSLVTIHPLDKFGAGSLALGHIVGERQLALATLEFDSTSSDINQNFSSRLGPVSPDSFLNQLIFEVESSGGQHSGPFGCRTNLPQCH